MELSEFVGISGGKHCRTRGWVVLTVFLAMLASIGVATSAARVAVIVLPSGSDDTAVIQGAFDECSSRGPGCTVELGAGTFHTGMIVVRDFHGIFRGEGEGRTVVESLPNLPVTDDDPIWLNPPSTANPWPDMFIFIDGAFSVADMTLSEPFENPTQGWTHFGFAIDALHAAILVIGEHADVRVSDVTLLGSAGTFFGSNVVNGIFYEGLVLRQGATDPFDLIPLGGKFSATNSAFSTIDNPLAFANLLRARVSAQGNFFDTTEYPFAFIDVSQSVLDFSHNRAQNVFGVGGVAAFQGLIFPNLLPSRLRVTENYFQVTGQAAGVLLLDVGTVKTLDVVVSENEIHLDESSAGGVVSIGVQSTLVSRNELRGAGPLGVYLLEGSGVVEGNAIVGTAVGVLLESTTGVRVLENEVKESGQWGIALIGGSSSNLVAANEVVDSGEFDLYWDTTGKDNVFMKNECKTSSPAGLCDDT